MVLPDGHAGPVLKLALSPDRKRIVTSGADGAHLWDLESGALVRAHLPGTSFCDNDHVVGLTKDSVESLALSSGVMTRTPLGEGDLLSPDGCTLAGASRTALKFFDTRTGALLEMVRVDGGSLEAGAADGVFSVVKDGRRETWSWSTRRHVPALDGAVSMVASNDGETMCSTDYDGIRWVDMKQSRVLFDRRLPLAGRFSSGMAVPSAQLCAHSADGSRIAYSHVRPGGFRGFAASDERVTVVDRKGKTLAAVDVLGADKLSFSAEGKRLRIDTFDPGKNARPCHELDIASGRLGACGAEPPTPGKDAVAVDDHGHVVAQVSGREFALDAHRVEPASTALPPLVREQADTKPAWLLRPSGTSITVLELPSLALRAVVPQREMPRLLLERAAFFDDGPGRLVGYRFEDCAVLRIAAFQRGSRSGYVAASAGEIDANATAWAWLAKNGPMPASPGPSLVERFVAGR